MNTPTPCSPFLQDSQKTTTTLWNRNRRLCHIMPITKSTYPLRCSLCSSICVRKHYRVHRRKVAYLMTLCNHRDLRVCTSLLFPTCATNGPGTRRRISNIWIKPSRRLLTARPPMSVGPGHLPSKGSQDSAPQRAVRDAGVVVILIGASHT